MNFPSGHLRLGSDAERFTSSRFTLPRAPVPAFPDITSTSLQRCSARVRSSADRNISGCQSTASGFTPKGIASCFDPSM